MSNFNLFLTTLLATLLSTNAYALRSENPIICKSLTEDFCLSSKHRNRRIAGSKTVSITERLSKKTSQNLDITEFSLLSTAIENFGDTTTLNSTQPTYNFTAAEHLFSYRYETTHNNNINSGFMLGAPVLKVISSNIDNSFKIDQPVNTEAYEIKTASILGTGLTYKDSTDSIMYSESSIPNTNISAPILSSVWLFGSVIFSLISLRKNIFRFFRKQVKIVKIYIEQALLFLIIKFP